MTQPFVMAAPNGVRRGKADHPAIPISIDETVATAVACHAAGADALHLHVRDAAGGHSLDIGLYREALAELDRALPGMPVQITTEAGGIYDTAAQLHLVEELRPKWISLSLREAARDMALAERLYRGAVDATEIQHIIFDEDDARLLADWQNRGVLSGTESVILVLGRYTADMNSDPAALASLRANLPPIGKWMLCAFGPNEHECLRLAASQGGDVRIGFENSYLRADGTPWPDNAASVEDFLRSLNGASANPKPE